jgi:hypothetical protein
VLREFRRRSATGRSDRATRRLWRRRTTPRLRGPSMKARTAFDTGLRNATSGQTEGILNLHQCRIDEIARGGARSLLQSAGAGARTGFALGGARRTYSAGPFTFPMTACPPSLTWTCSTRTNCEPPFPKGAARSRPPAQVAVDRNPERLRSL